MIIDDIDVIDIIVYCVMMSDSFCWYYSFYCYWYSDIDLDYYCWYLELCDVIVVLTMIPNYCIIVVMIFDDIDYCWCYSLVPIVDDVIINVLNSIIKKWYSVLLFIQWY